jgi:hypothetical protein
LIPIILVVVHLKTTRYLSNDSYGARTLTCKKLLDRLNATESICLHVLLEALE